jgi:hypothetical protein
MGDGTTAAAESLFGIPIKDLGAWGILAVIAIRYLLEGGQVSLRLYKTRRNGKNGQGNEPGGKVEQIVICPLDRAGTTEKVNTIERHVEQIEARMLPQEIFLEMQKGIGKTNEHLAKLVMILEDRRAQKLEVGHDF